MFYLNRLQASDDIENASSDDEICDFLLRLPQHQKSSFNKKKFYSEFLSDWTSEHTHTV